MLWCPKCKYEYREGFIKCNDCGSELVEESKYEKCGNKEHKKKVLLLIVFIFVFGILIMGYEIVTDYNKTYSISGDREQLEKSIKQYVNLSFIIPDTNNNFHPDDIIKQVVVINNYQFVLIKLHDDLAYVELVRGLNNKYKFGGMESTMSPFLFSMKEINKANYIAIFGRNLDKRINYAEVTLYGKKFKINIPKEEYFIVFYPISISNKSIMLKKADFELFDINSFDITKEMYGDYYTLK